MPVPNQADVEACLTRLEPALQRIVLGAWDEWMGSGQAAVVQFPRTRANLVWDYIVRRARDEFGDIAGVVAIEGGQTLGFLCDDRVLFRFKKGDGNGLSRNYPTPLALAYHDHDENLLGLPDVMRVEVVYILNHLKTAVTHIQVVCREGGKIIWGYDILRRGETGATDPLPLIAPPAPSTERLVRLRGEGVPNDGNRKEEKKSG
jgi:hypothetical protein